MAAELRLSVLSSVPPLGFMYRRLTFDMTAVLDTGFRAQLAQIIDVGFAAGASAPGLRAGIDALQGDGGARGIKFFTSAGEMAAGSGSDLTRESTPSETSR